MSSFDGVRTAAVPTLGGDRPHRPGESRQYFVSWAKVLYANENEYIASRQWTLTGEATNAGAANVSEILVDGESYSHVERILLAVAETAAAGKIRAICEITTNLGRVLQQAFFVDVEPWPES